MPTTTAARLTAPTAVRAARNRSATAIPQRAPALRAESPTSSEPEMEHQGIEDRDMGRILALGGAIGVPLTWAVATLLLMPLGLEVAVLAAIFVGIASGPFFGGAAFLMARVVQQASRGR